jgi:hypothetical protein
VGGSVGLRSRVFVTYPQKATDLARYPEYVLYRKERILEAATCWCFCDFRKYGEISSGLHPKADVINGT